MRRLSAVILAGAALASCRTAPPEALGPDTRVRAVGTREAMIDGINPAALAIWHIRSNAAAAGGPALDPALMDPVAWSRLEDAARMLAFYSRRMAEADLFRAGGPDIGSGPVPAGIASREEVQAMIDADPQGFRAISRQMAEQADGLAQAAAARDPVRAGALATAIDEPCQSCHLRYWYEH